MTPTTELLTQVTALLGELTRRDRRLLADTDLVFLLGLEQQAARQLSAAQALTAGEIAERSDYALGAEGLSMRYGERKPVNFIEQVTRVSQAEAARRVRVGLKVRPRTSFPGERLEPEHPIVAAALTSGELGADAADVVLGAIKQAARGCAASPESLAIAEAELVELAATSSTDLVADAGRMWRDFLDPDGVEPRDQQIRARRMLVIGREHAGIKRYTIHATATLSSVLDAALLDSMDPSAPPRFLSAEELENAARELVDVGGRAIERIHDPRTIGQKQHDILEGVLAAGLKATRDETPAQKSIGSVTAVISLADLKSGRGFGILEGRDEVVPASVIQELACEYGISTVLLGASGEPLFLGATERYFTGHQRRAMIARDGDCCIVKGCTRRAAACHAHHVVYFSNAGPTDVGNGVLLCPAHHHALHQGAFEIRMTRGRPHIRTRANFLDDDAWWPAGRNRLRGRELAGAG